MLPPRSGPRTKNRNHAKDTTGARARPARYRRRADCRYHYAVYFGKTNPNLVQQAVTSGGTLSRRLFAIHELDALRRQGSD